MLERVDCGLGVLTVVGADGDRIKSERLVVDQLLVGSVVGLDALDAVLCEESGGLAGNEVSACDDLNVGLCEVSLDVRICNPAAADNGHTQLAGSVNSAAFLRGEGIQTFHRFVCHDLFLRILFFE